jgi:hypothetical protein
LKKKLDSEKEKKKASIVVKKRKVTPIKIKELAAKKQKIEKEKSKPRKKATPKASSSVEEMDLSASTSNSIQQPQQQSACAVVLTTPPTTAQNGQGGEKQFEMASLDKKKVAREPAAFNDKNLDYNLFSSDPDNVISKKIKIASNVIVTCRMMEGNDGRKTASAYEFPPYAALSFLRKTKNEMAFEFNLPLVLAPKIIEALKLMMNDNPKFFSKHKE